MSKQIFTAHSQQVETKRFYFFRCVFLWEFECPGFCLATAGGTLVQRIVKVAKDVLPFILLLLLYDTRNVCILIVNMQLKHHHKMGMHGQN